MHFEIKFSKCRIRDKEEASLRVLVTLSRF